MTDHKVVGRAEWQAAREELLQREKEHTRMADELARQRRELPWVAIEKEYLFDADDGTRTLAELFDGRSRLLIYHFMFGPTYEAGCPTCSSMADGFDGLLPHLHARDLTLAFVSRAPLEKLQATSEGWVGTFPGSHRRTPTSASTSAPHSPREQVREQLAPLAGESPPTVRHLATATGTDVPDTSRHYRRPAPSRSRTAPSTRPTRPRCAGSSS
jgi:predicted dithiol-disulfide oxidoreductase (DUF899 family)